MNLTAKVKVVIADDHELIIDAIKNIINLLPNYQTVCQAKNGLEVYGVCLETEPDMIIIIKLFVRKKMGLRFMVYVLKQNRT